MSIPNHIQQEPTDPERVTSPDAPDPFTPVLNSEDIPTLQRLSQLAGSMEAELLGDEELQHHNAWLKRLCDQLVAEMNPQE